MSGIYSVAAGGLNQICALGVLPHAAHHTGWNAQLGRLDRLVGSLAARAEGGIVYRHGLAALGQAGAFQNNIIIQASDYYNFVSHGSTPLYYGNQLLLKRAMKAAKSSLANSK